AGSEPAAEFYGDRNAGVRDPTGNQWWIATHKEDVPPDELARRAEAVARREGRAGGPSRPPPRPRRPGGARGSPGAPPPATSGGPSGRGASHPRGPASPGPRRPPAPAALA